MNTTSSADATTKQPQSSGQPVMDSEDAAWFSMWMAQQENTDFTPPTVSQQEYEKWGVCTSIDVLLFSVFEDVSVTGDVRHLSRNKATPEHILKAAWDEIRSQWGEAIGGEISGRMTQLAGEIEMYDSYLRNVQMLIDAMADSAPVIGPLEQLADALREYGFYREFSAESWEADLQWVVESAKRFIMERDLRKKEAQEMLPEQSENDSLPTRETFTKALWQIEKKFGTILNKDQITVRKFCIAYRDFLNHVEAEKNRPAKAAVQ